MPGIRYGPGQLGHQPIGLNPGHLVIVHPDNSPGKVILPWGTGQINSARTTATKQKQADRELTVSAADGVVPCVYGRGRVGGKVFYVNPSGGCLYVAYAIAEGEIDSYEQILLDNATSIAGVTVETHVGAVSQAVSTFLGSCGYTQTHPGLAYIVLKITALSTAQGIPAVLCDVKGKKILDTRTGVTAWSENEAWAIRDVLTGAAGRLDPSRLVDQSFKDAADWFDVVVDGTGVGSVRNTLNLVCANPQSVKAWVDTICLHCAATLTDDQGKYSLIVDKSVSGSPVAVFDDSNSRAVTISRRNGAEATTRVIVQWTDAANGYVTATAMAEHPGVTDGTREPIETTVPLQGCTNQKEAVRATLYILRRQTLSDLLVTFTASPLAKAVRRGDLIALTHRDLLSAQELLIMENADQENGEAVLTCEEYDVSAYSTAAVVVDTPISTGLPDPTAAPGNLANLAVTAGIAGVSNIVVSGGLIIVTTSFAWGLKYDLPATDAVPLKQLRLRLGPTWGTDPNSEIVIPLEGNTTNEPGQTQDYKLEFSGWVRQIVVKEFYAAQSGSSDPVTTTTYEYDPEVIIKVESSWGTPQGVLSSGLLVGGASMTTSVVSGSGATPGAAGMNLAVSFFWLGR
jgi:hypothetical protein